MCDLYSIVEGFWVGLSFFMAQLDEQKFFSTVAKSFALILMKKSTRFLKNHYSYLKNRSFLTFESIQKLEFLFFCSTICFTANCAMCQMNYT